MPAREKEALTWLRWNTVLLHVQNRKDNGFAAKELAGNRPVVLGGMAEKRVSVDEEGSKTILGRLGDHDKQQTVRNQWVNLKQAHRTERTTRHVISQQVL